MQDQELILKLKELKNISPRKEWVLLAKTRLFQAPVVTVPQKAIFTGFFTPRALTYSFAALLVVVAGMYGVGWISLPSGLNIAKHSTASLAVENDLKNNVEIFKVKSQNLSEASKSKLSNVSFALQEVKVAAKNISETIKKDPELAGKVALDINNNKTYLDVAGGNASNEVSDMYQTIVVQMVKDLDGTTLTRDQENELARIKIGLDKGGDYTTALRDILLISRAGEAK